MIRKDLTFLEHILEAIKNIDSFVKGKNESRFLKDVMLQSAVIRQVEVIGEAVKNLPIEYSVKYPQVEWSKIAGTRDKLIHNYMGVDAGILWRIIIIDLPQLKKEILQIKQKELEHG
ncbi:MAG: DUF86 domain-containing protein [Nanoarchaeota archaeon]